MVFVDRGDASSAVSSQLSQYQSMAEFLKAMLEAARRDLQQPSQSQGEQSSDSQLQEHPEQPESTQPLHPIVAELKNIQESEQQQAMTEISAQVSCDLVQSLGMNQDGEFYYQSESYTIYTTTPEDSTIPIYRVTDAEHNEILSFRNVDGKPEILNDQLSPQDKLNFVGAAANLHQEGVGQIMAHPNPNDRFARLGELSPSGTRAAWVAQVVLEGRDDYPPLGKESQNRFVFERDRESGQCRILDTKQGEILQISQSGAISSTMSRDHLEQFKEIHTQMYRQVQKARQSVTTHTQPKVPSGVRGAASSASRMDGR